MQRLDLRVLVQPLGLEERLLHGLPHLRRGVLTSIVTLPAVHSSELHAITSFELLAITSL